MGEFVRSMAIESWTLHVVGLVLIACRIVSRCIKLGGPRNLQIEDYLMLLAGCTFTGVIVCVNEVAKNGSNYMAPAEAAALTPEGVARAVFGSKMTLVLEMFTLTTVWLVKACLLILYHKLTGEIFPKQHLAIKFIAAYCGISYVVVVVLCLTYWCRPIYEYWRVPVRYSQCATYYHHMIFATSFNVSSDLMLLLIPLPIIIKTRLPPKRKLVLCCVLGLGVFNIIAAVLNRYYNFSNPNNLGYAYWYVGEVAVAVCVGNVPLCWPLIRQVFRAGSWFESEGVSPGGGVLSPPVPAPLLHLRSRKKRRRDSSIWLSTWGKSHWDKVEDDVVVGAGYGRGHGNGGVAGGKTEGGGGSGSEIELTPGWHREANLTAVSCHDLEGDIDADDLGGRGSPAGGDADKGVIVVKTVRVERA